MRGKSTDQHKCSSHFQQIVSENKPNDGAIMNKEAKIMVDMVITRGIR